VDELRGLKENVIMGRLLPAGTGLGAYNKIDMVVADGAVKPFAPTRPAILEPEPVAAAASEE
jgi:DNA-directed RNA polymerase subunit beta'